MISRVDDVKIKQQSEIMEEIRRNNEGKNLLACVSTLGCVQNENDSQRIKGMLTQMGYTMCDDVKIADVVVFNTCAVRENAEKRVFGYIGALKNIKADRPGMIIGLCGCMMQQQHIVDRIKSTYKHVDMVFGTHSLHRFPQILHSAMSRREFDIEDTDGYIAENLPYLRDSSVVASVSVMYGCNNFCSYCIVPYVRGRERSRAHNDIINEVSGLAAQGYKEVTLVGQNVNSYGKDCGEVDFADLVTMVSEVDGIERIRFVSSHPKDVTDKLIAVIRDNPKVCKQLHLPFQSGSNKVLSDMNRKYTKEHYLELVDKIKEQVPEIALTGDIIVGFPTENQADFEDTLDVVKKTGFDMLYTFIYSKRKGTPAEKLDFVLTEEQIKKNFDLLVSTQADILYNKNLKLKDKVLPVLVEGESKTNKDTLTGRTDSGKIVNFSGGREHIGSFVDVKITHVATWALTGEIIYEKGE